MQNSMQTYARQTLLFGEDELTSLQVVSPASRSRSRASAKARRTSVTCGRKCCGLFGLFDLAGSWARTFSELLIGRKEWSSSRCVLTWRRQDMRFNRSLYRLAVSVLPTEGTDAGLLPTVQTQGLKQCEKGKTVFMPLKLLPTPTAIDAGSGRINRSLSPGAAERPTLALAGTMGLLPTPTVNDATNSSLPESQARRESGLVKEIVKLSHEQRLNRSRLNPLYVAEMMSFPMDWTVLPFLAGCGNRLKPTETPSCLK